VEPVTSLFGAYLFNGHIAEMVQPKRSAAEVEMYKECTFKPRTNSPRNDKLAKERYEKDQMFKTDLVKKSSKFHATHQEKPAKDIFICLYLDG
jgi:hypothetical protein